MASKLESWRRAAYNAEECLAGCLASPEIAKHLDQATVRTILERLSQARIEMLAASEAVNQPAAGEPIQVEAVAITRSRKNGGLALEWLIEGGISALEGPDVVLLVADGRVWDDEGSGEVYLAPPAETPVRGAEPLAWMTRPLRGSNAGKLCICDPSEARDPELWATPFPVFATRRAAAVAAVAAGEPFVWIVESPKDLEPVTSVCKRKDLADRFAAAGWTVTPVYAETPASAPVAAGEPVAWVLTKNGEFDWDHEYHITTIDPGEDPRPGFEWRALIYTGAKPAAAYGAITAEVLAPFLAVVDAYDPAEDDAYVPAKDWMMDDALRLTLGQFRALKRAAAHGDGLSFRTVDELAEAIRQVSAYEDLGPELIAEEMFKQAGVGGAAYGDEAVRKDADRYRFLRANSRVSSDAFAAGLDEVIDKAMRAQGDGGGE